MCCAVCCALWRLGVGGGGAPVVGVDLEEKLDGVAVELEGDGLEEGDEVCEDLLVAQVEAEADDVVEVVVAEQEEHRRLLGDVGDQDRQRLHTRPPPRHVSVGSSFEIVGAPHLKTM